MEILMDKYTIIYTIYVGHKLVTCRACIKTDDIYTTLEEKYPTHLFIFEGWPRLIDIDSISEE